MAANRWAEIITGDLPFYDNPNGRDVFAGQIPGLVYTGPVEDITIGVSFENIDGEGGTLGQAGPTFIWTIDGVPVGVIAGQLQIDSSDFGDSMDDDSLFTVILHEMGHCLGLFFYDCTGRERYDTCEDSPLNNPDTTWSCPRAIAEYNQIVADNPESFTDPDLRMEGDGGDGTRCGHWEEDNFVFGASGSSELMTGTFESGICQPLTRVTVGALESIQFYEEFGNLDFDECDPYPFNCMSRSNRAEKRMIQMYSAALKYTGLDNTDPESIVEIPYEY